MMKRKGRKIVKRQCCHYDESLWRNGREKVWERRWGRKKSVSFEKFSFNQIKSIEGRKSSEGEWERKEKIEEKNRLGEKRFSLQMTGAVETSIRLYIHEDGRIKPGKKTKERNVLLFLILFFSSSSCFLFQLFHSKPEAVFLLLKKDEKSYVRKRKSGRKWIERKRMRGSSLIIFSFLSISLCLSLSLSLFVHHIIRRWEARTEKRKVQLFFGFSSSPSFGRSNRSGHSCQEKRKVFFPHVFLSHESVSFPSLSSLYQQRLPTFLLLTHSVEVNLKQLFVSTCLLSWSFFLHKHFLDLVE